MRPYKYITKDETKEIIKYFYKMVYFTIDKQKRSDTLFIKIRMKGQTAENN